MQNKQTKKIIVALDGYSSCGKSTFAKLIAKKLGYLFIDTGAMYRAVALYVLENGVNVAELDEKGLGSVEITFRYSEELGRGEVFLNGRNVDALIRTLEVSNKVSEVAKVGVVRDKLVEMQRKIGSEGGVVMDGRDIGTVVFPQAEIKIFMTADVMVRAQRRYDEMKGEVLLESIAENIRSRDYQDENREHSPLRRAEDAVELDNSYMNLEQQMVWFDELYQKVVSK